MSRSTRSTTGAASISPTRQTDSPPLPRRRRGATPEVVGTPLKNTPSKIRTRRASLADTPQDQASPVRRSRRLSTNTDEIATPSKVRNLRGVRNNLKLVDQPVPEEEELKQRAPNSLRQKKGLATSMPDENRNEISTEKGSEKSSELKTTETSNEKAVAEKEGTRRKVGRPAKGATSPRLQNTVVMLKKIDDNAKARESSASPVSKNTRNSLSNGKGEVQEDCKLEPSNSPKRMEILEPPKKVYSNKNKQFSKKGHTVTDDNVIVILDDEEEEMAIRQQEAATLHRNSPNSMKQDEQNKNQTATIDKANAESKEHPEKTEVIIDLSDKESAEKDNESAKSSQEHNRMESNEFSKENPNIEATESIPGEKVGECTTETVDKDVFDSDSKKVETFVEKTELFVNASESMLEEGETSRHDAESFRPECVTSHTDAKKTEFIKDNADFNTKQSIADESVEKLTDEKPECVTESPILTREQATTKANELLKENPKPTNVFTLDIESDESMVKTGCIVAEAPTQEDLISAPAEILEPTKFLKENSNITKDSSLDAKSIESSERANAEKNESILTAPNTVNENMSDLKSAEPTPDNLADCEPIVEVLSISGSGICGPATKMSDSFGESSETLVEAPHTIRNLSKSVAEAFESSTQVPEPEFEHAKQSECVMEGSNLSIEVCEADSKARELVTEESDASVSRTESMDVSVKESELIPKVCQSLTEASAVIAYSKDVVNVGIPTNEVGKSELREAGGESKEEMEKVNKHNSSPKEFENIEFAKSWNQSVKGPLNKSTNESEYIDAISIKQTKIDEKSSPTTIFETTPNTKHREDFNEKAVSSGEDFIEEDDEEASRNEYIDDEALEVSEDECSLNSSERAYLEENEIPVKGESIGSEDTLDELDDEEEEEDNDEDEEMASFIVTESELDKLSGNDSLIDSEDELVVKKKFRRVIENSETSSDECEERVSDLETRGKSNSPKETEEPDRTQLLNEKECQKNKSGEYNHIAEEKDEENENTNSFPEGRSSSNINSPQKIDLTKHLTNDDKCSDMLNFEDKISDCMDKSNTEKNLSSAATEVFVNNPTEMTHKQCDLQKSVNDDNVPKILDEQIVAKVIEDVHENLAHNDSNSVTCFDQSEATCNKITESADSKMNRLSVTNIAEKGRHSTQASSPKSLCSPTDEFCDELCEEDTEAQEIGFEKDAATSLTDSRHEKRNSDNINLEKDQSKKTEENSKKDLLKKRRISDSTSESDESSDNTRESNYKRKSLLNPKLSRDKSFVGCSSKMMKRHSTGNIKGNNLKSNLPNTSKTDTKSDEPDNESNDSDVYRNAGNTKRNNRQRKSSQLENSRKSYLSVKYSSNSDESSENDADTENNGMCIDPKHTNSSAIITKTGSSSDNTDTEVSCKFSEDESDANAVCLRVDEEKDNSEKEIEMDDNLEHVGHDAMDEKSVSYKSNLSIANKSRKSEHSESFSSVARCNDASVRKKLNDPNEPNKLKGSLSEEHSDKNNKNANYDHSSTEKKSPLSTYSARKQSDHPEKKNISLNINESTTYKKFDSTNTSPPTVNKKGNNSRKRPYSEEFAQKSVDINHEINCSSSRRMSNLHRNKLVADGNWLEEEFEPEPETGSNVLQTRKSLTLNESLVKSQRATFEEKTQTEPIQERTLTVKEPNYKVRNELESSKSALQSEDKFEGLSNTDGMSLTRDGKMNSQLEVEKDVNQVLKGRSPMHGKSASNTKCTKIPADSESSDSSGDDFQKYLSIAKNIAARNKSKSFSSAKKGDKLIENVASKSDGEIFNDQESGASTKNDSNRKKVTTTKNFEQEKTIQNYLVEKNQVGGENTATLKEINEKVPLLDDSTNRDLDKIIMAAKKKVHSPEDSKALMKTISKLVSKSLKKLSKLELPIDESHVSRKRKTKRQKSQNIPDKIKNTSQGKGSQDFTEVNFSDSDSSVSDQKYVPRDSKEILKRAQPKTSQDKQGDLDGHIGNATTPDTLPFASIQNTNQSTPAHSLKIKVNDMTYCSTDGHENAKDYVAQKSTFDDSSYTIATDSKINVCEDSGKNRSASGQKEKSKKKRDKSKLHSKVAASNSSDNSFENYLPQSEHGNKVKPVLKSKSIPMKKPKFGEQSEVLKELIVNRIEEAKAGKTLKKKKQNAQEQHHNLVKGAGQLSAYEAYHMINQKKHKQHTNKAHPVEIKLGCQIEDANASTSSGSKSFTSVASSSSSSSSRANEWLITDLPKNKKSRGLTTRLPFGFEEKSATPKKVNGFQVEAVSPKPSDWIVTSIHQNSKERSRKRLKLEKNIDPLPLPGKVWTPVGYFKVTDADTHIRRQKHSRDFSVENGMQSKKRRNV